MVGILCSMRDEQMECEYTRTACRNFSFWIIKEQLYQLRTWINQYAFDIVVVLL